MAPDPDLFGFIRRQNLDDFRKLLVEAKDGDQRRSPMKLLAEEETNVPFDLEAIQDLRKLG
jgi:hypothetical protein